jgi:hypothetical protein
MPISRSPNGAAHTSPQTDRDRPEWVMGINRNHDRDQSEQLIGMGRYAQYIHLAVDFHLNYPLSFFLRPLCRCSRSQAAGGRESPRSLKSQLNSEGRRSPDSVASGWRCGNAMLKGAVMLC